MRPAKLLGHSWPICPFSILLLAVTAFPAVFRSMTSLAQSHLRLAGAVAQTSPKLDRDSLLRRALPLR
ncbi:NrsF family protein [Caballeronia fortuita]|uniref:NrsF family protein n=1 Tax=Caballeronia fortuita TaxID=1777138 RepID=UPI0009ED26CB